jgi:hypothetical protein
VFINLKEKIVQCCNCKPQALAHHCKGLASLP